MNQVIFLASCKSEGGTGARDTQDLHLSKSVLQTLPHNSTRRALEWQQMLSIPQMLRQQKLSLVRISLFTIQLYGHGKPSRLGQQDGTEDTWSKTAKKGKKYDPVIFHPLLIWKRHVILNGLYNHSVFHSEYETSYKSSNDLG